MHVKLFFPSHILGCWIESWRSAFLRRNRFCQGWVVWSWAGWALGKERWCCGWNQVLSCSYISNGRLSGKNVRSFTWLDLCVIRYFQCQPKYGLFAPVHKVTRIGFPSTTPAKAKTTVRKTATTPGVLKRSPSASSISSMSSVASSASCKPSRTGLVNYKCHLTCKHCTNIAHANILALLSMLKLCNFWDTNSTKMELIFFFFQNGFCHQFFIFIYFYCFTNSIDWASGQFKSLKQIKQSFDIKFIE